MMNPLKNLYNQLPSRFRGSFRRLIPASFLRRYAHRNTDVYLISYPKCGRTWLRLMVGKAIALHYGLPETEDLLFIHWKSRPHPSVPHITVIHEDRPMLKTPAELETSKSRFRDKLVIFLARDPRDVIVSSYFEMKNRGQLFGDNPYEDRKPVFSGSLQEFITREQGGFSTILRYYNIWAENREVPRGFLLIRYEDLKIYPLGQLRKFVDFIGLTAISDQNLSEAVEFASFENMRKMESEAIFTSGMLRPANADDRESYKTRKGKVRGYLEYLNDEEIRYLDRQIQDNLSPFFGYTA